MTSFSAVWGLEVEATLSSGQFVGRGTLQI